MKGRSVLITDHHKSPHGQITSGIAAATAAIPPVPLAFPMTIIVAQPSVPPPPVASTQVVPAPPVAQTLPVASTQVVPPPPVASTQVVPAPKLVNDPFKFVKKPTYHITAEDVANVERKCKEFRDKIIAEQLKQIEIDEPEDAEDAGDAGDAEDVMGDIIRSPDFHLSV